MTQTSAGEPSHEAPKAASAPVIAQHEATLKALPFADTRDFDDAARGIVQAAMGDRPLGQPIRGAHRSGDFEHAFDFDRGIRGQ